MEFGRSCQDTPYPGPDPDPVFPAWMQETIDSAQALEKSIGSGKRKAALRDFGTLGGQHCNRCHLKMRWQLDGGA